MNGNPMKTNKLPKSAWPDSQAAGSQSQQTNQTKYSNQYYLDRNYVKKGYLNTDNTSQTSNASNDASYHNDRSNDMSVNNFTPVKSATNHEFGYKKIEKSVTKAIEPTLFKKSTHYNNNDAQSTQNSQSNQSQSGSEYKKAHHHQKVQKKIDVSINNAVYRSVKSLTENNKSNDPVTFGTVTSKITDIDEAEDTSLTTIPERIFMNGLIKHTGIALAIIIPLAAFSAYAATPPINAATKADVATNATTDKTTTETLSIKPSAIIHKTATTPTTVDSVDLKKYAGTWYEIGRLPMYFQRNCASDATATYVEKTDGSGVKVINQCKAQDGSSIIAEGLAKPADATGSKLKVTFLPSWIRWVPVGRADYWVLARDADYKTALVGTPDKDYLWLLARSPNVSQETYAKYRQIAQKQGYDLKEFKLTPQSNQTVKLVP